VEHIVFLGLGANVGDRLANLQDGLRRLGPEVEVMAVSALYETDPVGVANQPSFLNAVCSARTKLDPRSLLDHVKGIERDLGRKPGPRWGPRRIDIDLLLYDAEMVDTPSLRIPHERLSERGFVLRPLADLDAQRPIPGLEGTVAELLARAGSAGVRRIAESGWERSAGGQL